MRAEHIAAFEEIYAAAGAWAELFQNSQDYLGTELLVDKGHSHRYITIDRWRSSQDYESFLANWKNEYEHLDAQCAGLTEQEFQLSKWETRLTSLITLQLRSFSSIPIRGKNSYG